MQNDFNRPSRKGDTPVRSYPIDALQQARESVADAVILNPKMPAIHLAELLMQKADPDVTAGLHKTLERDFYRREALAIRRAQAAERRVESLLPGFEHLPLRIPGLKKTRIRLLDANYRRVRDYYWSLMKAHSASGRNDPKIKEAKKLMDTMQKRARTEQRITVREVVLLEA